MHIFVCIKQVPDTQKVKVDPETGVLIRSGIESKMNPFDLYALETALRIKEKCDAYVTAISMGPFSAEEVLKEALAMGVDDTVLLSDRKFGGADVLATSYTLAQGIRNVDPDFDLIICGKQTTDGDTGQVGPAISEYLGVPHVSWCSELVDCDDNGITVKQRFTSEVMTVRTGFPCLVTVEKGINTPRLPSYLKQKASENVKTRIITFADMNEDETHFGLSGSATSVERIFEPDSSSNVEIINFDDRKNAEILYERLKEMKYTGEGE